MRAGADAAYTSSTARDLEDGRLLPAGALDAREVEGGATGAAVAPRTDNPRPALLEQLAPPAVTVGETGPASASPDPGAPAAPAAPAALSAVRADDAGAMAQVLDHLYGLGHRRIAHVAGLPGLAHTERRIASLRAEAERLGLAPGQVRSVTTEYSDAEGAEATRRILAGDGPPTAIVYDNDVMAVAGVAVASELGIPVPGVLSVVAWDDSALCRVTRPPLTALVPDTAGFGRLAAEELLALLAGGPPRSRESERPRLEPRESTAPPPAAY